MYSRKSECTSQKINADVPTLRKPGVVTNMLSELGWPSLKGVFEITLKTESKNKQSADQK